MNKRIEKLAEQSVSRFDKDMEGSMEPTENGRWVYYDDLTEFAELIVRECMEVILAKASEYPETDEWYDWTSGMDQAQAEICVHFGVEE